MRCILGSKTAEIDVEDGVTHIYKLEKKVPPGDLLRQVRFLVIDNFDNLKMIVHGANELDRIFVQTRCMDDDMPDLLALLGKNMNLRSVEIPQFYSFPKPLEDALAQLPNLRRLKIFGEVILNPSRCYQLRILEASLKDLSCVRTMHHLKYLNSPSDFRKEDDYLPLLSCERLENFSCFLRHRDIDVIIEHNREAAEIRHRVKFHLLALIEFTSMRNFRDVMKEIIKEI